MFLRGPTSTVTLRVPIRIGTKVLWAGSSGRARPGPVCLARPRVRVSAVECIDLASGCCELTATGKDRPEARIWACVPDESC